MVNEINAYAKEYVHLFQNPQPETTLAQYVQWKKTSATLEEDTVPFNWTGWVQVLKNLQGIRIGNDYANNQYVDVSNSNDLCLIFMSQDQS